MKQLDDDEIPTANILNIWMPLTDMNFELDHSDVWP